MEETADFPACKHVRQPADIVRPHFFVRDSVHRSPKRDGLRSFDRLPDKVPRNKDAAMQAIAIEELKMKLASQLRGKSLDAEFLARFAHSGVKRCLPWLNSAPWSVDFSRSQPALLAT